MCFLVQTVLFVGASLTGLLTVYGLHTPYWVGVVAGLAFFVASWIAYEVYQAKHPDWWPSWDEGLPQSMRMANAFVPAVMVFVFMLILFPVFQKAKEKAALKRQRLAASQKTNLSPDKTTAPVMSPQMQRKPTP